MHVDGRGGRCALVVSLLLAGACSSERVTPAASADAADAAAGLDSLNARIERAYREHDFAGYGKLYTDSATFEWPAVPTARGGAAMEAMARELWTPLPELQLRLIVNSRRIAAQHATEHGAFEESWRDSTGGRTTEFGRYVVVLARQPDASWRMDRFFGFSDSTRSTAPKK